MTKFPEWEQVGATVWRFPVPGGWLYNTGDEAETSVFVPDPEFYRKLDDGGVQFHDVE